MRGLALFVIVGLSASCAHQPPPVPPTPVDGYFYVPQTIPGSWAFCVEQPHQNSQFMTPVARKAYVCPYTVDELRIWVASIRPAD